jgi:hypothetical protein
MTTALEFDAYAKDEPDADICLVADYIGGFLSAADKKAFEERMIDDERFFLRMAPFLAPWAEPGSLPVIDEIEAQVEAAPVVPPRAAEVDIPRRRTKGLVAAAASVAIQIKIIAALATAAGVGFAVAYRFPRPATSTPPQITVQVPPTVVRDSAPRSIAQVAPAHVDRHTTRTHHAPVIDAGQSIDVVQFPAPVDSATERAVAEMVGRSLPEGQVTPSATTLVATGPQAPWVPRIWVEVDTTQSLLRDIKNALATGARGTAAVIAWPFDAIRRRIHHVAP